MTPSLPSYPQGDTQKTVEKTPQEQAASSSDRLRSFFNRGILSDEHPAYPWLMLAVLVAGVAIVVLDGTIVTIALPHIIRSLSLTLTQAQWVTAIYSVIFAALLLTMGSVADRIGRRRVFAIGIIIFLIGSILAALSLASSGLICARAVQGIGGAFVLPSTLSMVHTHFQGKNRSIAFGIWGASMAAVAAVGPLLGATLLKFYSWPSIFIVNIPICLIIFIGVLILLPNTKGGSSELNSTGYDLLGFLLSSAGMGAIVYGIIEGPRQGWWHPSPYMVSGTTLPRIGGISAVPALLAVGLLLIVAFCAWEVYRQRRGKHVIVNLSLFRFPTFSWGNITALCIMVGQFSLVFLLPLYFMNCLDYSVMATGGILAAMAVGAMVSGALARKMSELLSPAGVVVLGTGLEAIAIALLAGFLNADLSVAATVVMLILYGVGLGFASAQLTSVVLLGVPTEVSGMGSSVQTTFRQLGTAAGFAVAGTVLSQDLIRRLPRILDSFGTPKELAHHLVTATVSSAGSNLNHTMPPFGDFLTLGFVDATRATMWVSVAFLILGFIGSLRVWAVSRHMDKDEVSAKSFYQPN